MKNGINKFRIIIIAAAAAAGLLGLRMVSVMSYANASINSDNLAEEEQYEFSYSVKDAEMVYNEANDVLSGFLADGKKVLANEPVSLSDMTYFEKNVDYKSISEITPELFTYALYERNGFCSQFFYKHYAKFNITFSSADGENAKGIESVTVIFLDNDRFEKYSYNGERGSSDGQKGSAFTAPSDKVPDKLDDYDLTDSDMPFDIFGWGE